MYSAGNLQNLCGRIVLISTRSYDFTGKTIVTTKIDNAFKDVYAAKTAQSVWNDIKELQRFPSRRTRWIWELLQNAIDASPLVDNHLIAEVKYRPGKLIFSHNGRSFKAAEVAHLIASGSTKYEDEEAIGEFGSGFLTTHLLSLEIEVSGQLDDGQEFAFLLARNMESRDALEKSMKDAEDDFKNSLNRPTPPIPSPFTTQFIYPIREDDAVNAVEAGIETLEQCAPYVVVFNKKFDHINIDVDIKECRKTFSFKAITPPELNSPIQQITVEEYENSNLKEREYLRAQGEEGTSVAVPLESNSGKWKCLPLENISRIFKAFPLIGTESFSFPAVINNSSDFFTPTEARDDIPLGESNDKANTQNRAVIKEACKLLVNLLKYASSKCWHHVHRWAEIPVIQHNDEKTREWLRTCVREKLIEEIHQTHVVLTQSGKPIEPNISPLLPVAENDEGIETLWDLLHDWSGCDMKLPRRDEAIGWYKTIESWAKVLECDILEIRGAFNGEKLASEVDKISLDQSDNTRIHRISNLKKIKEGISVINWLDRLLGFLQNHGLSEGVDKYNIVPNQAGLLRPSSSLFCDIGVDEELKNIAELLGWYVRREFRDNQLTSLAEEAGAGDRNSKNIVESLIKMLQERVSQVISSQNPDTNFKQAALQLFAWLVRQNQQNYWYHLWDVPIFTKDGIYHPSLLSVMLPNDPLLAPIRAWSENLQQFSELFPPNRILDDSFFETIPDIDIWQMLCEQNFIRRNMIRRWDGLTDLKPFSPEIYENEDDGGDHESEDAFSAIVVVAWEPIMDRVRNSRDNAYLFWRFLTEYLIKYLIEKTGSANLEEKFAQCKFCGKIHKYYPSIWLKAVRTNKWIRDGGPRFRADAPSLAKLLREKGWDLGSLENPSTVKLLTAINVSPSDLRLELIAGNPEERDTLVSTMTELHQITGGDLSQVQAIVQHVQKVDGDLSQTLAVIQHMQEDENFSEYLAERQEQTRRVHENQHLGTQVENLVRENLENEGFLVSPTGIGSDFEIRLNIVRNDKNWLIEVKSTRQEGDHQSVRMTSTQAETAVKEKDKFLLCVVPLGQEDIIPETVRENTRFIQNIGDSIAPLWEGLKSLKKKPVDIDIILDVEEGKAGILVKKSVWEDEGFPLEKLAEHLK